MDIPESLREAIALIPTMRRLDENGVISVNAYAHGHGEFIQLTDNAFCEIFGNVKPNENGIRTAYAEGVEFNSVARARYD